MFLLAVLGLIGNSMIIVAVMLSRKLQTSTNVLVTNLAVTDLLNSFFWIWFAVSFFGKGAWILPKAYWLCQLTAFMVIMCTGTSMYTLAAIGMDRLLIMIRPTLYDKIFKSKYLWVCVAITWIIPGGTPAIYLLSGVGAVGYDVIHSQCSDLDDHDKAWLFNLGLQTIGFGFPFITIVITYSWIYIHLKIHFKKMKENVMVLATISSQDHLFGDLDNQGSTYASSLCVKRRNQISQQQLQITKNLFCVVLAFFACFLPFFFLVTSTRSQVISHIEFYLQLGAQINSSINFVIYASKHPDFKVVLRHMMKCSYAEIQQPSRLLKYLLLKRKM